MRQPRAIKSGGLCTLRDKETPFMPNAFVFEITLAMATRRFIVENKEVLVSVDGGSSLHEGSSAAIF